MFHPHRGGIERVSDLLSREFKKRGHNVFFLHTIRDETLLDYPYPAPLSFFPFSQENMEQNGAFYRDFLIENRIEIVINQDLLAYHALCGFSTGLKTVHTISVMHGNPLLVYDYLWKLTMRLRNDTFIEKVKRIARIIKIPKIKCDYWQMLKTSYEDSFVYSDLVCLLSPKFIPELKRIYPHSLDKLIAIADPNTYSPQQLVGHAKRKQILYVGRIAWHLKRVDRLVGIWKRLYKKFPDWELIFVGDGPIKKKLECKFAKQERVVFTGYQDPEQYYKDASIICLTSDTEGWGMVLTEAMTFGTIPVAFNSYAAVTDIIDDGETGLLVPPFSSDRFACALETLMTDEDLRCRMSQACMQSVRRFDITTIADQWEAIFERLN